MKYLVSGSDGPGFARSVGVLLLALQERGEEAERSYAEFSILGEGMKATMM
jgi:hypothetical protein